MFYQEFVPNGPLTAQLLKHAFSSLKCYSKYCILSSKEESFLQKKKKTHRLELLSPTITEYWK